MAKRTIKNIITNLARNAVLIAEEEYGSGQGKLKKEKAINYIIENLPFPSIGKRIISIFLSNIIDEIIEASVDWMHSLSQSQGD